MNGNKTPEQGTQMTPVEQIKNLKPEELGKVLSSPGTISPEVINNPSLGNAVSEKPNPTQPILQPIPPEAPQTSKNATELIEMEKKFKMTKLNSGKDIFDLNKYVNEIVGRNMGNLD